MDLQTPIRDLGITYKMNANKLERLGIYTLQDLLFHIPQRYDNLSIVSKINVLQPGEVVTIQGRVNEIKNIYTRRRFQLQKAIVEDETGYVECMWFNQPYVTRVIHKGNYVSIAGRVDEKSAHPQIMVKDYEELEEGSESTHTGRLVPVYPETKGLTSKWIRNRIKEQLLKIPPSIDYLPERVRKENNLLEMYQALQTIHFPKNITAAEEAKRRLAFDELFLMQLQGMVKRKEWQVEQVTQAFETEKFQKQIESFWEDLPFELTGAQKKAIHEIFQDLSRPKPMNRLLEGDVGSGKTVVAAAALYLAHLNGFQGVFMAPTSILAEQHYKTVSNLLSKFGVKVCLILGGKKFQVTGIKYTEKNKKKILNAEYLVQNADVIIGTHAILNEKATFKNLGLVVIDEQQRFGVEQRGILRQKGSNPHFLTMTATPIPRTVFLTMYGDLDLSYLDEMPKGRKIVKTWFVPQVKRDDAYEWIKKQIKDHRSKISDQTINQAFIVCPFIEESESMTTVKAATKEYERLKSEVFPEYKLGLLHGRMKSAEKQAVLDSFQKQEFDMLVTTPVVEVGIDIPNATIIVIEAAERFGLAQLHQLRGRVGRSDKESFCLLFADQANTNTISRLKLLERSYQGAELAELDLKLRGPGDMYGTMQHGSRNLKVASFSDFGLIEKTKKDAEAIFSKLESYPELQEKLKSSIIDQVTPD